MAGTLIVGFAVGPQLVAEDGSTGGTETRVGADPQLRQQLVNRSIRYLSEKGQADDGSYSAEAGPAITALVTSALIRSGRSLDDPLVAKSLEYLQGFVQPNGGIYAPNSLYRNYETCITMMCLIDANRDGRYQKLIDGAERFVKDLQNDEGEGYDPSHPYYGGGGYGKHRRPDLSNTGILIDALVAAGNGPDDPHLRKALIFVKRLQQHEDADTMLEIVKKNPDGGFIYATRGGGESQAVHDPSASKEENEQLNRERGLRSYASMTYMGLKSLIYAGLTEDDERVQAARAWIAKNYRLDANPGLGKNGLFYYYHTFAKTMNVLGDDYFVDAEGVRHDWRRELVEVLAAQQNEDGSWINEQQRWMEGDPNLVTAYALLALSYCD
ncbi:MAG: hypothetical protein DWQ31_01805 [Planctomycetota bacterium]|nr:MAG: hypothetical protein DWQ31_08045 [Planctomycetota bacterium]REJ70242.1 MAG: hypothetical protein DWQ31_01805 [Planctomycetota bacterium]REJ87212.1 MAG: hypothetical protein DWQ35_21875 [Planctomycetota bacterium]REK23866.1 MAG: hypothetical protein DWQ42_14295 [Planctomycetota bacterium]REK40607.1 MAG: hypothetical protein DWQ46_15950 [Planctomycetota bacterium]